MKQQVFECGHLLRFTVQLIPMWKLSNICGHLPKIVEELHCQGNLMECCCAGNNIKINWNHCAFILSST